MKAWIAIGLLVLILVVAWPNPMERRQEEHLKATNEIAKILVDVDKRLKALEAKK